MPRGRRPGPKRRRPAGEAPAQSACVLRPRRCSERGPNGRAESIVSTSASPKARIYKQANNECLTFGSHFPRPLSLCHLVLTKAFALAVLSAKNVLPEMLRNGSVCSSPRSQLECHPLREARLTAPTTTQSLPSPSLFFFSWFLSLCGTIIFICSLGVYCVSSLQWKLLERFCCQGLVHSGRSIFVSH